MKVMFDALIATRYFRDRPPWCQVSSFHIFDIGLPRTNTKVAGTMRIWIKHGVFRLIWIFKPMPWIMERKAINNSRDQIIATLRWTLKIVLTCPTADRSFHHRLYQRRHYLLQSMAKQPVAIMQRLAFKLQSLGSPAEMDQFMWINGYNIEVTTSGIWYKNGLAGCCRDNPAPFFSTCSSSSSNVIFTVTADAFHSGTAQMLYMRHRMYAKIGVPRSANLPICWMKNSMSKMYYSCIIYQFLQSLGLYQSVPHSLNPLKRSLCQSGQSHGIWAAS